MSYSSGVFDFQDEGFGKWFRFLRLLAMTSSSIFSGLVAHTRLKVLREHYGPSRRLATQGPMTSLKEETGRWQHRLVGCAQAAAAVTAAAATSFGNDPSSAAACQVNAITSASEGMRSGGGGNIVLVNFGSGGLRLR
mmetsp:Transcript_20601/g.66770  ORF Transcript_20601/g.66770 Transcript_20601/m.66770 type:complete len:137 (-) Transcript_20601:231-641(-)